METITWDNDIEVMYVTATSFPEGIMEAHQKLHGRVPFSTQRKYLGISRPEGGPIVYRACAEVLAKDEPQQYGFDTLILKKGTYYCIAIHNYMQDMPAISKAFDEILKQPGIDPEGYCVEWYTSQKDVNCMVRMAD